MTAELTSKRLHLRKWQEYDAPYLYRMARDPDIGKGAGWLAHTDEKYSKAIIRTVLSYDGEYAITLKGKEEVPIGSIGLRIGASPKRGILREDEAEVGYWLGKDFWNNGYASEALSEIIRYSFVEIGLSTVWCGFFDGNERSRRVIERCGLTYDHRNEHLFNSMLNEYYNENMMKITAMEYFLR